MTQPISNDNIAADAHGQAAMLLAESLLHGLIARSAISVAEAVEIVEVAMDAGDEVAADRGDAPAAAAQSQAILAAIRASLSYDLPD